MKVLIGIFFIVSFSPLFAKEIVLDCKGTQTLPIGIATMSYQVAFDDEKNVITWMTEALAFGCFPSDSRKSTGCDCRVTDNSIGCKSSFIGGKDENNVSRNVFYIDRHSGRMAIIDSVTLKDSKTKKSSSYTAPGDLNCEVITERKF